MIDDRAEVFLDAFAAMGQDAIGLGDRDLSLGRDRLLALAKKAKFPMLSANIVDKESKKPLFQERVILDRAGFKVGVFSVVTQSVVDRATVLDGNGIEIADPIEAAKEQVRALEAEGAQIIVALAHVDMEDARKLAQAAPKITAILGTNSQQLLRYPEAVGTTYVCDAFSKGKYLSVLSLFVADGDKSFVFSDPNRRASLVAKVSELETRIDSRVKAIEMAKKEESRARNVEWLEQNLAQLRAELQEAKMDLDELPADEGVAKSLIAYDLESMAKNLEDDAEILKKTEALKEKYPVLKEAHH
jgi:5'-nucleotidase